MHAPHPTAARGFAAGADAYERARPDYPADAVSLIADRLDLRPGRTLLELGAGTGKLTRMLVRYGARILALEPVAEMREKLATLVPGVELIGGTAEAIPLPAASVDAVVAAQAFHWFDTTRALSEIHRVLRPGGRLLLAWNMRDESVPWVRAMGELIHAVADGEPRTDDEVWRDGIARSALFAPFASATFEHAQRLTRDGVRDRVASVSYVAAASPSVRDATLAALATLLDTDPTTAGREVIDLPYQTEVLWADRRSPALSMTGVVASVNVSRGGVPKLPVDGTRILRLNLEGDGHNEPEPIHGGPDQAVSLYAQEAIERVRADGHDAFAGAYGENLTMLGIDWAALRSGDRLAFGEAGETSPAGEAGEAGSAGGGGPLLELTQRAAPCQTIAHWFVERRIARISPRTNPQDSRWYARVIREGHVAPGMPVRVIARGA
jgi:MOSC domain-containing protein YiiM/SAM-dependent methyltransferase